MGGQKILENKGSGAHGPPKDPPNALLGPHYTLLVPPLDPRRSLLVRPGVSWCAPKQLKTNGLEHMALLGALHGPSGGPGCAPDAPKSSPDDLVDGPNEPDGSKYRPSDPQMGPNDPQVTPKWAQ